MNIKLLSKFIYYFKSLFMIINESGEILYLSDRIKELFDSTDIYDTNIIPDTDLKKLKSNEKTVIKVDEDNYILSKIFLENQKLIIINFDLMDDNKEEMEIIVSLKEIIENISDGVLLTDKNGEILIYNKAMADLEKYDAKNMVNKKIWEAYGYNDKNKSEHMKVFKDGISIINKYKAHAYNNGKPIFKQYSTYPIRMGKDIIGVYSISKDEMKIQNSLSEIVELKRQYLINQNEDSIELFANGTRFRFSDIIGSSKVMKSLIEESKVISWLDNSILLVGDTGTGKEVFAQSIHNFGSKSMETFIGVNCSAIPENLFESILFGSVKGAYTGAIDSIGLIEEASEGTIFLDELNLMPINMQAKLLRVLQEKSARRVGGRENYPMKCRIISAMNEDPAISIKKGKLRKDLYYRVSGFSLYIPSLIDRDKDLFEFAKHYISKFNISLNKNIIGITDELKELMAEYKWPGNIRELEHFIENTMVKAKDKDRYLTIYNIPKHMLDEIYSYKNLELNIDNENELLEDTLGRIEREIIIKNLNNNRWNVTKTAKELGITRQSLIYKMKKFDIGK